MASEPSDEELIAFADSLLGDLGERFLDVDLLRETITEQRDLWLTLFRISRGEDPDAGVPSNPDKNHRN